MSYKHKRKINKISKIIVTSIISVLLIFSATCIIGISSGSLTIDNVRDYFLFNFPSNTEDPLPSSPNPINSYPTQDIWSSNVISVGDEVSGSILSVHFIDVGQGDSILIEFPDNKIMLIDGGDTSNYARDSLLNYLEYLEIDIIDYLMLTHTDEDHLGALDEVIDMYPVKEFFIPNLSSSYGDDNAESINGSISTYSFNRFIERALSESYMEGTIEFSATITYNQGIINIYEDNYSMTIYAPDEEYYQDINNNSSSALKNNMSPISVLEYGGRAVVFTGDAYIDAELRFVNQIDNLDADVLKVAHHGSSTSSNDFFLNAIDVEYAVICCGENNPYNHPAQDAIDRLIDSGVECLFRTDLCSDIKLEIDSDGDMKFYVREYVSSEDMTTGYN